MYLTTRQKLDIVILHGKGMSYKAIANKLGIDQRTVSFWVKRFTNEQHLNVSTKNRGRKRKLTDEDALSARAMLLSGKFPGAKQVANEISKHKNVEISASTVIRSAKWVSSKTGAPQIRCARSRPVKQLNPQTVKKRLSFAKAHRSTNWSTTMFIDRKKFCFFFPKACVQHMGWVEVGKGGRTAPKVNNPMVVNLYAGITKYGPTKVHIVAGTSKQTSKYLNQKAQPSRNITISEMEDVLVNTIFAEGKRIFSAQGLSHFQLLLDNDPTHKKAVQNALERWEVISPGCVVKVVANYPPHSPDLNPIENVWSWVQRKVEQKGCDNFEDFKEEVIRAFQKMPESMLRNLFKSMSKRMAAVIKNQGGKTRY
jgi:transposase